VPRLDGLAHETIGDCEDAGGPLLAVLVTAHTTGGRTFGERSACCPACLAASILQLTDQVECGSLARFSLLDVTELDPRDDNFFSYEDG